MGHEVTDSSHGLERNNRPNNHERIHLGLREARHVAGLVAVFVIYSAISYAIINWGVTTIQQGNPTNENGLAAKAFLNGIDPNALSAAQYLIAGLMGLMGVSAVAHPSFGSGDSTVKYEPKLKDLSGFSGGHISHSVDVAPYVGEDEFPSASGSEDNQ